MFNEIFVAFIPMFFAMDAIGLLPIFSSLTEGLNRQEKQKVIFQSMVTAVLLAIGFIFLGKLVFKMLGIEMGDFMVAGGAILFIIAIKDLTSSLGHRRLSSSDVGAVPIGTPLVVGPGVLTVALMQVGQYGVMPTIVAVLLNILIVAIVFTSSDVLMRAFGKSGARAISKVMALLLAAIGVMMIRRGILEVVKVVNGT